MTAELDVLSRADLLRFLRAESEESGVTIVYASHVLEGLASWATDMIFLSPGRVRFAAPMPDAIAGGSEPSSQGSEHRDTLHALCERWMREDRRPFDNHV